MTSDERDRSDADVIDGGTGTGADDTDDDSAGVNPIRGRPASFGLAIAGFVALIAAQVLPWQILDLPTAVTDPEVVASREQGVGELNIMISLLYNLSVAAMLALVGLALAIRPRHARAAGMAAIGWVAGHFVMVVGVLSTIGEASPNAPIANTDATAGIGLYSALASVALLGGAAGLAAFRPQPVHRPVHLDYDFDDDEEEPLDLTVSSAPPTPVTPLRPGDGR